MYGARALTDTWIDVYLNRPRVNPVSPNAPPSHPQRPRSLLIPLAQKDTPSVMTRHSSSFLRINKSSVRKNESGVTL